MKLKPHQKKAKSQLHKIMDQFGISYLVGEVRTGKSATVLKTFDERLKKNQKLLCITSKSAIKDIEKDYRSLKCRFKFKAINFEKCLSGKYREKPDALWIDEAHRIGAYPKPGKICKAIKVWYGGLPTILSSGTPSPESFSQLFHQLWVTKQGPWDRFISFYKWAHRYVNIVKEFIGFGRMRNNYSETKKRAVKEFNQLKVTMTQKDAKFNGKIIEHFHYPKTPKRLTEVIKAVRRNKVYDDGYMELIAETAAHQSQMIHQLSSGTIIGGEESFQISKFKPAYIRDNFKGKKIAIYYLFKAEGRMLKKMFTNWTDNPARFNKSKGSKLVFIKQIRSGREGISLKTADCLIFMNISHSAVSYWQARARSQSFDGGDKHVHWIFSTEGVEGAIYDAVVKKQDFTLKHFKQYVRDTDSIKNRKAVREGRISSHKTKSHRNSRMAGSFTSKKWPRSLRRSKTPR